MMPPPIIYVNRKESHNIYLIMRKLRAELKAQKRLHEFEVIYENVNNATTHSEALKVIRQSVRLREVD